SRVPSSPRPPVPQPAPVPPSHARPQSSRPPPPASARKAPESDPLARLPSLEPHYDDEDARDTSGTHFALDLVESGELGTTDPSGDSPDATGFDEMPTEVVRTDWEDETTRRPLEAAAAIRRQKSKPSIRQQAPSIEDTIKIEGDIEAHFARMHPNDEKPRA